MTWTVETAPVIKDESGMCAAELLNHLEVSGWQIKNIQVTQREGREWIVIVAWQP